MKKTAGSYFIVAALLLAIVGLRVFALSADPPRYISGIGTAIDDTQWAVNARNKVVFGSWVTEPPNLMYVTPITNLLTYSSFEAFGVGFVQFRLPNVILSVLTALVLYLVMARQYGSAIGALGLLLLGINYVYVVHSRMGRPEISIAFFMVINLLCWQSFLRTRKPIWAFCLGLVWLLPPIAKVNAISWIAVNGVMGIAVLGSFGQKHIDEITGEKRTLAFIAGTLISAGVFAFWIVSNFSMISATIAGFNDRITLSAQDLILRVYGIFYQNTFFIRMPILTALFVLGCIAIVLEIWQGRRSRWSIGKCDWVALFASLWIFVELAFFPIYHVEVYRFIDLIPPMVILAGKAISWLLDVSDSGALRAMLAAGGSKIVSFWALAASLVLWPQAFSLVKGWQWFWRVTPWTLVESVGVAAGGTLLTCFIALYLWRVAVRDKERYIRVLSSQRVAIVAGLIVISVVVDMGQHLSWAVNRQFTQVEASRSLRNLDDKIVFGGWARILSLENRIKPIFVENKMGVPVAAAEKMTEGKYFLVGFSREIGDPVLSGPMQRLLNARQAKLIREFPVREYTVRLYEASN